MRMSDLNRTPTWSEALQAVVDRTLMDLNTSMPGEVVVYDPTTQMADVQPSLLTKYEDGTIRPYPIIPNVPVKQLRGMGGLARIHMPLQPGDEVQLVFSQRSLDNWKLSGGLADPDDRRRMHLADAVAYIGGASEVEAFEVEDPTALEIVNGAITFSLKPTGQFKIANATAEFVTEVSNLCDILASASTVVGGPFIATVIAQLVASKAKFDSMKVVD